MSKKKAKNSQEELAKLHEENDPLHHRNFSDRKIRFHNKRVREMAEDGETISDICKVLRIRESHPSFVGYRTRKTIKYPYAEGYRKFNQKLLEQYKKMTTSVNAVPSAVENAVQARMAEVYSTRVREAELMNQEGLSEFGARIIVNPKLPNEKKKENNHAKEKED